MPVSGKPWNSYSHWKLTTGQWQSIRRRMFFLIIVSMKVSSCTQSWPSQAHLTSGWTGKWLITSQGTELTQGILKHPSHKLISISRMLCPSKTSHLLLPFHMTALPLCGTQMSKRRWEGGLSNPLLSLGSRQHQMLPVTWEITVTIATYQVQGQSEFSANAAKVEFLSSCLNNLY